MGIKPNFSSVDRENVLIKSLSKSVCSQEYTLKYHFSHLYEKNFVYLVHRLKEFFVRESKKKDVIKLNHGEVYLGPLRYTCQDHLKYHHLQMSHPLSVSVSCITSFMWSFPVTTNYGISLSNLTWHFIQDGNYDIINKRWSS